MTIISPVYEVPAKIKIETTKKELAPAQFISKANGREFSKLKSDLLKIEQDSKLIDGDLHKDLLAIQRRIIHGAKLTPQELLIYQIQANQFGLKIEMVAKVGESLTASIRKLQNQQ